MLNSIDKRSDAVNSVIYRYSTILGIELEHIELALAWILYTLGLV